MGTIITIIVSNAIFLVLGFLMGKNELQSGVIPAMKRSITGARGAILTRRENDDRKTKQQLKEEFLAAAQKNPNLPLPDGLNEEDFL